MKEEMEKPSVRKTVAGIILLTSVFFVGFFLGRYTAQKGEKIESAPSSTITYNTGYKKGLEDAGKDASDWIDIATSTENIGMQYALRTVWRDAYDAGAQFSLTSEKRKCDIAGGEFRIKSHYYGENAVDTGNFITVPGADFPPDYYEIVCTSPAKELFNIKVK